MTDQYQRRDRSHFDERPFRSGAGITPRHSGDVAGSSPVVTPADSNIIALYGWRAFPNELNSICGND
jgi:hypothetical protein